MNCFTEVTELFNMEITLLFYYYLDDFVITLDYFILLSIKYFNLDKLNLTNIFFL